MSKAERLAEGLESYGQGCTCYANSSYECGCEDAVWPDYYTQDAAIELRRLHAENIALLKALKLIAEGCEINGDGPTLEIANMAIWKAEGEQE